MAWWLGANRWGEIDWGLSGRERWRGVGAVFASGVGIASIFTGTFGEDDGGTVVNSPLLPDGPTGIPLANSTRRRVCAHSKKYLHSIASTQTLRCVLCRYSDLGQFHELHLGEDHGGDLSLALSLAAALACYDGHRWTHCIASLLDEAD
jgi:hypothetical protein